MSAERLYFDYNATMPLIPEAFSAMTRILHMTGNASSVHRFGREMRQELEEARKTIASHLKAIPEEIIFTSGGSEANNTVIHTFQKLGARIIVSAVEHACVLKAATTADIIPVNQAGVIDLGALETLLQERKGQPTLVSVMLANNETGVIQPLEKIVALAHQYGAKVHSDCAQALGKIPFTFADLGVDYLSLSSHKIGGPLGAGVLIVKKGASFEPFVVGAGQEKGRRAGTYNTPAFAGFAAALEIVTPTIWQVTKKLRDYFEVQVKEICPEVLIFGFGEERLPNTSYIAMPGVNQETQLVAFDLEGIAVSAGTACTSGKIEPSHVLIAMGFANEVAREAIRVSFGPYVTQDQVDRLIHAWKQLYERTR
jgi:cysteine desulfurase